MEIEQKRQNLDSYQRRLEACDRWCRWGVSTMTKYGIGKVGLKELSTINLRDNIISQMLTSSIN